MSAGDTIYALATGPGVAAISIVRISGPRARDAMMALAGHFVSPRRATLSLLVEPESAETIDEAVVIWAPGPGSFTGEDCLEFQIHGSTAVQAMLLSALGKLEGLRLAEPGEFTRRAVANGKMDLVQAEGLGDLLAARTIAQQKQAIAQTLGRASAIFDSWREQLLQIRASIEAVLDFVDEEGVAEQASAHIDADVANLIRHMEDAVSGAARAESIREGVRVVLAGFPNTGKSSLLNAVAARDAAIVSSIPGTTRDVIEVFLDLAGVPVVLTDTAGLRTSGIDVLEAEGIRRAELQLRQADVVVWVAAPDIRGSEEYGGIAEPDILVWGKQDLPSSRSGLTRNNEKSIIICELSVKCGAGVREFIEALQAIVMKKFATMESAVVVSRRQLEATTTSIRLLNESLQLDSSALELKAECVRGAAQAIGRLTGRIDVEEWLGAIFSRFCIGK